MGTVKSGSKWLGAAVNGTIVSGLAKNGEVFYKASPIRHLKVGDKLTYGTMFYFKFPEDLGQTILGIADSVSGNMGIITTDALTDVMRVQASKNFGREELYILFNSDNAQEMPVFEYYGDTPNIYTEQIYSGNGDVTISELSDFTCMASGQEYHFDILQYVYVDSTTLA